MPNRLSLFSALEIGWNEDLPNGLQSIIILESRPARTHAQHSFRENDRLSASSGLPLRACPIVLLCSKNVRVSGRRLSLIADVSHSFERLAKVNYIVARVSKRRRIQGRVYRRNDDRDRSPSPSTSRSETADRLLTKIRLSRVTQLTFARNRR